METKLNSIIEAISSDIATHEKLADNAMLTLEQMNVSPEDYKKANICFCLNSCVARYLGHIKSAIEKSDIKSVENLIRFHSYYQHIKGDLQDNKVTTTAQAAVAVALDGYIARFFDIETNL